MDDVRAEELVVGEVRWEESWEGERKRETESGKQDERRKGYQGE
jgi:hypothetical protein